MTTIGILIGMPGPSVISPASYATETRRSCFCELELFSLRKELGELSISICALLPCSCNSSLCLWTMAPDESYV